MGEVDKSKFDVIGRWVGIDKSRFDFNAARRQIAVLRRRSSRASEFGALHDQVEQMISALPGGTKRGGREGRVMWPVGRAHSERA